MGISIASLYKWSTSIFIEWEHFLRLNLFFYKWSTILFCSAVLFLSFWSDNYVGKLSRIDFLMKLECDKITGILP